MTQRTTNPSHSSSSPYEQGIEAAAKAICEEEYALMAAQWDNLHEDVRVYFVNSAKAGIEAFLSVQPTRREKPERCKHGSQTMHVGGEHACAGPIAEEKRYWLVEQKRVST